ncbi:hypothetical protein [Solidesulfovibrio sp.]
MHKGNALVSTLISMVFIMGMLAPVPECYVTRIICPSRATNPCQGLSNNTSAVPSRHVACCSVTKNPLTTKAPSPCLDPGKRVKPYVPDLVSVEVSSMLVALPLLLFQAPVLADTPHRIEYALPRYDRPDPIPILQKKQSLLI